MHVDSRNSPGFKLVKPGENLVPIIVSVILVLIGSIYIFGGFQKSKKRKRSAEISLESLEGNTDDSLFTMSFHNDVVGSKCEVCLLDADFQYGLDDFFENFYQLHGPTMNKKQLVRSGKLCDSCKNFAENSRDKQIGKTNIHTYTDYKKNVRADKFPFDSSHYSDLVRVLIF